jgi:hypothetical protein
MSGVFISYRRDDSAPEARRLFERLAARFGSHRVFIDAVTLEPGQDFAVAIREKVAFCNALVAVIGPEWLETRTPDGRRRLDDPDDRVRVEIASALSEKIHVIPALFNGAALPDATRHRALDEAASLALRRASYPERPSDRACARGLHARPRNGRTVHRALLRPLAGRGVRRVRHPRELILLEIASRSFSRAPPRVSTQHFRRFPGLCRF